MARRQAAAGADSTGPFLRILLACSALFVCLATPRLTGPATATTPTHRGRCAAGSARSEAEPGRPPSRGLPPEPATRPQPRPAPSSPPPPPALPGRWDLPPGQGDLAKASRRPPVRHPQEPAGGSRLVWRPPLILCSPALSSSPTPPRFPLRLSSLLPPTPPLPALRSPPAPPAAPRVLEQPRPGRRGAPRRPKERSPAFCPPAEGKGAGRLARGEPFGRVGQGAPCGMSLELLSPATR